jgi:hypothetical protein
MPRSRPREVRASVATSRWLLAEALSHFSGRKPEWGGQVVGQGFVEGFAGQFLDQLPEHHQAGAGIAEGVTGRRCGDQRRGEDGFAAGGVVRQAGDLGADRQSAGVRQQHRHSDAVLAGAGESGKVGPDRRGEVDFALIDQLQHEDRCVDLGQRGDVEDRVGPHGDPLGRREFLRPGGVPQRMPDSGVHRDLAVDHGQRHRTGVPGMFRILRRGLEVAGEDLGDRLGVRRRGRSLPHRFGDGRLLDAACFCRNGGRRVGGRFRGRDRCAVCGRRVDGAGLTGASGHRGGGGGESGSEYGTTRHEHPRMIPDRTVSGKVTFDEVFSTRSEIRNDRTGTTDQNSSVVFVGCAVAGTAVASSLPPRSRREGPRTELGRPVSESVRTLSRLRATPNTMPYAGRAAQSR